MATPLETDVSMRRLLLPTILVALAAPAFAQGKYVEDFEFISKTVARDGAAVHVRKIDWKDVEKEFRPLFEACTDDEQHVENVMRLLAVLSDSHTGVTRSSVPWDRLPSKWDGLYGGGLWFGFEDGRFMVRGLMEGHSLEGSVAPGTALVAIGEWPAWLAMEREKRRITRWAGSSSDHSLFTSMSNRLLPFGEASTIEARFLEHEKGKVRKVAVPRWGPGGKAYYPSTATLPDGVESAKGAVSAMLESEWCERLGYVRITGGMNAETVAAFHGAFDRLEGAEAILLDCRWMGGGSDDSAWQMCGRFFPKGANNGLHGRIEPSGSWQFDGPVVMLQNESEVSSAETFTWGMSETKRCVSVGRPTGGWGIIPRGFQCPSGLIDFRLGVNARPTPIERVQTEGVGWPPDVVVPFGPVFCAENDPVRTTGLEILQVMHAGVERDEAAELFGDLFAGDVKGYGKRAAKIAKRVPGWKHSTLAKRVEEDLAATLALELELVDSKDVPLADALGATRRLERLADRAKKAGLTGPLRKLQGALKSKKAEVAAQTALLELADWDFQADEKAREAFLKKHGKTDTGRFARDVLWDE